MLEGLAQVSPKLPPEDKEPTAVYVMDVMAVVQTVKATARLERWLVATLTQLLHLLEATIVITLMSCLIDTTSLIPLKKVNGDGMHVLPI